MKMNAMSLDDGTDSCMLKHSCRISRRCQHQLTSLFLQGNLGQPVWVPDLTHSFKLAMQSLAARDTIKQPDWACSTSQQQAPVQNLMITRGHKPRMTSLQLHLMWNMASDEAPASAWHLPLFENVHTEMHNLDIIWAGLGLSLGMLPWGCHDPLCLIHRAKAVQEVHLLCTVWEGSFQGAPQALDLGSVEGDEAHRDRPGWGPALLFQAQRVHGQVLSQAGQQRHAQLRLSLINKHGVGVQVAATRKLRLKWSSW